ncbi:ABC transporter substrate-binding protein [Castellaniella hirudinis]|uniref:ABC transporter substrate-binding protein n=1 Tax=Castellaniella hirudinis TaxID=1144617 RepID=A0ABV8RWD1_9BURK
MLKSDVGDARRLRLVSLHEMVSLDPNTRLSDSSAATPVLKLICPNLVRLDHEMQIQPELASAWRVSDDQCVYRFILREGLRFHDGSAVDARSVVWNFERILDSRTGSVLPRDFEPLRAVRALNDHEVVFELHRPWPAFLHHLAGRCHLVADTALQPCGAGAFRLVEWVRGSHLRLQRFADYWNADDIHVDELLVTWAPDGGARTRLIESGDFDVMEVVPAAEAGRLRDAGLAAITHARSSTRLTLAMNCRRPPFDDPERRRAVARALDRQALVERYAGPHGRATSAVWGEDHAPVPAEAARPAGDRSSAAGGSEILQGVMTRVSPMPAVAGDVGAMLEPLGLRLDMRGYDDPPWWPMVYCDTDWQIAFQGMGTRAHADMLFSREFCTGGSFNSTGYSNPALDELVAQARHAVDPVERDRLYAAAQEILARDVPVIVLYGSDTLAGTRPGVSGFRAHPLSYWDLAGVRVDDAGLSATRKT